MLSEVQMDSIKSNAFKSTMRLTRVLFYEFAWPPRELSPNARVHWRTLARVKRQYRETCGWMAISAGVKGLLPPVRATVTFVTADSRRRDVDNHLAMLKPMWDALVAVGVLTDDNKDALTIEKPVWTRGKTKRIAVLLEEILA